MNPPELPNIAMFQMLQNHSKPKMWCCNHFATLLQLEHALKYPVFFCRVIPILTKKYWIFWGVFQLYECCKMIATSYFWFRIILQHFEHCNIRKLWNPSIISQKFSPAGQLLKKADIWHLFLCTRGEIFKKFQNLSQTVFWKWKCAWRPNR